MADVIRWLNEGNSAKEEVRECLREAGDAEALGAFRASLARDKRQRSSIYTTAETIVAAYADPRVLDAASDADYTPAKLLDGGASTLYLCAPAHEQERLRTVFATMICELVAEVYERSSKTGKPIDPPLLIVLDEAANIAPIPNLDEIASTGAGQGIQLLSVFQDLAQLHSRYGERAKTIVNNHRAKLFGTGISDPQSLDYVRRVTGSAEFSQRSRTAGQKGQRSTTEGDDLPRPRPRQPRPRGRAGNRAAPLRPPPRREAAPAALVCGAQAAGPGQGGFPGGAKVSEAGEDPWGEETVALGTEGVPDAEPDPSPHRPPPRGGRRRPGRRLLVLAALGLLMLGAALATGIGSGGGQPPRPADVATERPPQPKPALTNPAPTHPGSRSDGPRRSHSRPVRKREPHSGSTEAPEVTAPSAPAPSPLPTRRRNRLRANRLRRSHRPRRPPPSSGSSASSTEARTAG